MVRLSVDLIARGTSGYTKKKKDESINNYLRRLTHLYLEDRSIDDVGEDLALCRNLVVLYLYDNRLSKFPNLIHNSNLTHLYLQNNNITKLDNLTGLRKLTKLYLGGNVITVLEGFEKLDQLQELHLEHQKLPPGEKLLFDPRSIAAFSRSLQVLNVSGNNLDTIRDLDSMSQLTQFMCSDNQLSDMKELAHCLSQWRSLWRLELIGNPLCHKSKYRDRIIIMSPTLEMLDGKEITETSKQFLRNWQANKDAQKRKRHSRQTTQAMKYMEDDLPPVGTVIPRHAQIPGYLMPALPKKRFQEVLARSNSTPSTAIPNQHRTYSELSAPKYLNTYGTIYHNADTMMVTSSHIHRNAVSAGFADTGAGEGQRG